VGGTVLYARISDDRQEGAGVERQTADCRKLVARGGGPDAKEYIDNNYSAFSGKVRPAYQEMLDAARAGEVSRIVVYHLDRLYRRPRELQDLIDISERLRHPIQIDCVEGMSINLGTADGVHIARSIVDQAEYESRRKSERVTRAKQDSRDRGLSNGGPRPFGWKVIEAVDPAGNPSYHRDGTRRKTWNVQVLDEVEGALIRDAVDQLLDGVAVSEIARRWNRAGVPQPQTGRSAWTPDIVRRVVSNPRIAGYVGYTALKHTEAGVAYWAWPEKVGPGNWPAIVDREKWEQLQVLLKARGDRFRVPRHQSLLTGLVLCGVCGCRLRRTGSNDTSGGRRKVFRCGGVLKGCCGRVSIDALKLEDLVINMTFQRFAAADFSDLESQSGEANAELSDLVQQLDELDAQRNELATMLADGQMSVKAFAAANSTLDAKETRIRNRMERTTSPRYVGHYTGPPDALEAEWPHLSMEQQRETIRRILGKITVHPSIVRGRTRFEPERVQIADLSAGRRPGVRKKSPALLASDPPSREGAIGTRPARPPTRASRSSVSSTRQRQEKSLG
jgi:site-specific DNA recombinase